MHNDTHVKLQMANWWVNGMDLKPVGLSKSDEY
jgi:hypothetical protein